ncbi:sigma 54-interacting transcriptional regulator [Clostridium disporicum]|uniref:Sigma-54 factor interaction domain-containing protein n=1 Tax=Clostridium disporicum TaxID=84024 RepID=A0A174HD24_9CLOT|nr:sigma-54-dependent transcriptional regulator [Clostridium disporicum]CUO72812.1 sigma-54 factor interaction domain-containing protein [Clostridium disporicum]
MGRIDEVFNKLIELYDGEGVATIDIASELGLSRANVSNDLNRLCEEGKAIKKCGKPVLFTPIIKKKLKVKKILNENVLDSFVAENKSLCSAVEQAKASVLYPPNGMNMLVLGETGVGKSMFVSLIHKYGIEMKKFLENSPLITFNCADYANNPQLLLGQLFGCKKGAYTGADSDKIGLIEKANNGILFLDEVHRLPSEGQEMLFTFMDKGIYRRLGETEFERKAKVLIVCATTENPEKVLLKTFTRRIPMTIHIPSLAERSVEERFSLISAFMKDESARLDKEIKVSMNSIKALLSYDCEANIGQLKVDIQLICARAYAEYVSGKKIDIKVNSLDLPLYIRKGLYKEVDHRQLWNKLIDINKKYCIFNNLDDEIIFEDYKGESNIYELIEARYHQLKERGIDESNLQETINFDIDNYFKKYINKLNKNFSCTFDISQLEGFIDGDIRRVILEIINFSEDRLNRKLSEKVCYGIAVHINSSIDRIKSNKKITNPQLNKIRVENTSEFNIALDLLKIIERSLDISMPIDEAGFLAIFLAYDKCNIKKEEQEVKVIVIAHGETTATSMVNATNKLLGNNYAIGINAPIEESPEKVLERVKKYISKKIKSDILFLVDMGSLTTFAKEIEAEFNIKTRVMPLVSTLHVLEATRKAMLGYNVDEILNDMIKVNELYITDYQKENEVLTSESIKKLAILSVCTTGDGGAKSILNLLENKLNYDSNVIDIITMNLIGVENIENKINRLSREYKIISLISTFDIEVDIFKLSLKDIFVGDGIDKLQKVIDLETTYIKMVETLKTHLKHIDGERVLEHIKCFNERIQKKINMKIETNRLIGITLHIACMIDRLSEGIKAEPFELKEKFIAENQELFNLVKIEINKLKNKYYENIEVDDDEICYITSFFKGGFIN